MPPVPRVNEWPSLHGSQWCGEWRDIRSRHDEIFPVPIAVARREKEEEGVDYGKLARCARTIDRDAIITYCFDLRVRKCFLALGIETVGQLIECTPDELMGQRNFGLSSLWKIREFLSDYNLSLKGDNYER